MLLSYNQPLEGRSKLIDLRAGRALHWVPVWKNASYYMRILKWQFHRHDIWHKYNLWTGIKLIYCLWILKILTLYVAGIEGHYGIGSYKIFSTVLIFKSLVLEFQIEIPFICSIYELQSYTTGQLKSECTEALLNSQHCVLFMLESSATQQELYA